MVPNRKGAGPLGTSCVIGWRIVAETQAACNQVYDCLAWLPLRAAGPTALVVFHRVVRCASLGALIENLADEGTGLPPKMASRNWVLSLPADATGKRVFVTRLFEPFTIAVGVNETIHRNCLSFDSPRPCIAVG